MNFLYTISLFSPASWDADTQDMIEDWDDTARYTLKDAQDTAHTIVTEFPLTIAVVNDSNGEWADERVGVDYDTAYYVDDRPEASYVVHIGRLDENGVEIPSCAVTVDSEADANLIGGEFRDAYAARGVTLSTSSYNAADSTCFMHNMFYYLAIGRLA